MATTEISEVALPALFHASCDAMMIIDHNRRILAMNRAMEELTGRSAEDVVGKTQCALLLRCLDADGAPLWPREKDCPGLRSMKTAEPVRVAEYTIVKPLGREIAVNASYTPIPGNPDAPLALVTVRDVTDQKRREDLLRHQATTDALTGLPNRAAFAETYYREFKRAGRYSEYLAVAMADLDGFKPFNDAYGHPAGDEMLASVAALLKSGSRSADFIARYGGDEFALVLPETDIRVAVSVLNRMRVLIERFPFSRRKKLSPSLPDARVRMSFGVAVFPQEGSTPEMLLQKADYRLLKAKSEGGNRVLGPFLTETA